MALHLLGEASHYMPFLVVWFFSAQGNLETVRGGGN